MAFIPETMMAAETIKDLGDVHELIHYYLGLKTDADKATERLVIAQFQQAIERLNLPGPEHLHRALLELQVALGESLPGDEFKNPLPIHWEEPANLGKRAWQFIQTRAASMTVVEIQNLDTLVSILMAHYGADKSDLDKLRNGVAHAIEEFIGGKHKREKVAT